MILRREKGTGNYGWRAVNGMHYYTQPTVRGLDPIMACAMLDNDAIYCGLKYDFRRVDLRVGARFDTHSEHGCVCQSIPDMRDGSFDGLDSDGVAVSFNAAQVAHVYPISA